MRHLALGAEGSRRVATFEIASARAATREMALHFDVMRTGNGIVGSVVLIQETDACLSDGDDHGLPRETSGIRGRQPLGS